MKKLIFTLLSVVLFYALRAQVLYGTTSIGGNGGGTINQLLPATGVITADFIFDPQDGEYAARHNKLVQAQDGKFYGMTYTGGTYNGGTIYSYDTLTSTYAKLYDFDYTNGGQPYGSLIQANDGKLYGMTNSGGLYGRGTIFSFNPNTLSYTKLFDFYSSSGESPQGSLIQASDGNLYGMTMNGGVNNDGVIFSYDPVTNTYTILKNFDSTNGSHPVDDLTEASDGNLYATTVDGGANNLGVIFSYNPVSSELTKLQDFDSTDGYNPKSSLLQASDGNFYSMTSAGGTDDLGVIFSYNPVTSTYTKLKDFNYADGIQPEGSLIQISNGELLGMTPLGGSFNGGVLFSYNITTSAFTMLKEFNLADGANPYGTLAEASNGKLYGSTYDGGKGNKGVLFSYGVDAGDFVNLRDFGVNNTGSSIEGGLVKDSSGVFYGMAHSGGSNSLGTLFSFNSKTSAFNKLMDFNGANGASPSGSLTLMPDGKLYGLTSSGGSNNAGVIFSFNLADSSYTKLKDLDYSNGSYPYGNLTPAANGKLYGITNGGGSNGLGTLFSFDTATNVYTKLVDFDGTNGAYPTGSLMQATDGNLYGVTYGGGVNSWGVLFSYDPSTSTFTTIKDFNADDGINPNGTLLEVSDGVLYGMTSYGGAYGWGAIFSYNVSSQVYTKIKDFDYTNGGTPLGSLMKGSNGILYGMTSRGGAYDKGVAFSLDTAGNTYTKIQDFNGLNGSIPTYTFFTELPEPVLPLQLISFNAERNGSTNLLKWSTENEINTNRFEIERSSNSRAFVPIGSIKALGISKIKNDYSYTDEQPLKATNYYRLKIIDKDGKFSYSQIRSINNTGSFNVVVYPNPVRDNLTLDFNSEKKIDAKLQIVNAEGKPVLSKKIQIEQGASKQQINTSALSSGNYFIKITSSDIQSELKFIKQ
jgi:uncharacterized repeat protein (TIGR03803 family)